MKYPTYGSKNWGIQLNQILKYLEDKVTGTESSIQGLSLITTYNGSGFIQAGYKFNGSTSSTTTYHIMTATDWDNYNIEGNLFLMGGGETSPVVEEGVQLYLKNMKHEDSGKGFSLKGEINRVFLYNVYVKQDFSNGQREIELVASTEFLFGDEYIFAGLIITIGTEDFRFYERGTNSLKNQYEVFFSTVNRTLNVSQDVTLGSGGVLTCANEEGVAHTFTLISNGLKPTETSVMGIDMLRDEPISLEGFFYYDGREDTGLNYIKKDVSSLNLSSATLFEGVDEEAAKNVEDEVAYGIFMTSTGLIMIEKSLDIATTASALKTARFQDREEYDGLGRVLFYTFVKIGDNFIVQQATSNGISPQQLTNYALKDSQRVVFGELGFLDRENERIGEDRRAIRFAPQIKEDKGDDFNVDVVVDTRNHDKPYFVIVEEGDVSYNSETSTLHFTDEVTLSVKDLDVTKAKVGEVDVTTITNDNLNTKNLTVAESLDVCNKTLEVTANSVAMKQPVVVSNTLDVTGTTTTKNISATGTVVASGAVTGDSFTVGSDKRLKTILSEAPSFIEAIEEIPVYKYKYKDGGSTQLGVMAQDVELYFPESELLVNTREDEMLSLRESKLIYPLMKALQEEIKLRKELESKLKDKGVI